MNNAAEWEIHALRERQKVIQRELDNWREENGRSRGIISIAIILVALLLSVLIYGGFVLVGVAVFIYIVCNPTDKAWEVIFRDRLRQLDWEIEKVEEKSAKDKTFKIASEINHCNQIKLTLQPPQEISALKQENISESKQEAQTQLIKHSMQMNLESIPSDTEKLEQKYQIELIEHTPKIAYSIILIDTIFKKYKNISPKPYTLKLKHLKIRLAVVARKTHVPSDVLDDLKRMTADIKSDFDPWKDDFIWEKLQITYDLLDEISNKDQTMSDWALDAIEKII